MWQSFQETIGPVLAAVGALVIGGGAVTGFALWLFKLFGERWLSNRFAERLAAFRHEQTKELEQLRFEISKLLDRSTKLHQREFEVLPQAWSLLAESYHTTLGVTSAMQLFADLSHMGQTQLDEFIAALPLKDWQKAELKTVADKDKYYQDAISSHRLNTARAAARKSAIYLLANGIFMPPGMKARFDQIHELGLGAITEHEMNRTPGLPTDRTQQIKFAKEGGVLMKSLESDVQKRLWSAVATEEGSDKAR